MSDEITYKNVFKMHTNIDQAYLELAQGVVYNNNLTVTDVLTAWVRSMLDVDTTNSLITININYNELASYLNDLGGYVRIDTFPMKAVDDENVIVTSFVEQYGYVFLPSGIDFDINKLKFDKHS